MNELFGLLNRYLNPNRMPRQIRYYADDQPVLEHSWVTGPRVAGFSNQRDYILSTYPSLKTLPEAEREAAIRAVKTHLPPILEQAGGKTNPVYAVLKNSQNIFAAPQDRLLPDDFYFHAQSPCRNASQDVRNQMRTALLNRIRSGINVNGLSLPGGLAGEYDWHTIGRTYLLFELLESDALNAALVPEEKKTLNRNLQHSFYGFNGQVGMMSLTQSTDATILNKQVFAFNNLLTLAALFELQTARYCSDYWPGFAPDYNEQLRGMAAEIALGMGNRLTGDGEVRYVESHQQSCFYKGPQFTNYLNTWDDEDTLIQRAGRALLEQILAMDNYYKLSEFRMIEKDADTRHTYSRAISSEAKSFGCEIVNRNPDPHPFLAFANITGDKYICRSGPSMRASKRLESGRLPDCFLTAWHPSGPRPSRLPRRGRRAMASGRITCYGIATRWGQPASSASGPFKMIGRRLQGRSTYPDDMKDWFSQKDTFIGFLARNGGIPDDPETGLRTDHRMAHICWFGIFPGKRALWGAVIRAHPEVKRVTPGYPPHYEDAHFSATVTDQFAVQGSIARAKDTDAYCRELWLATPDGALGLLRADVDRDPANGNSKAHFSFLLQGLLGANQTDHYLTKYGFDRVSVTNEIAYPSLTGDGNGFDFLNLRVRVLDQNFTSGPLFARLTKPEKFFPTDKESPELRGLHEHWHANDEGHGIVSREVGTPAQFKAGKNPPFHSGARYRPWEDGSDSMAWEPMTWDAGAGSARSWTMPSSAGQLRLIRFVFELDESGKPRL